MKIQTVRFVLALSRALFSRATSAVSAEEYYKNDYPDEEDSSSWEDDSSGVCSLFSFVCFLFDVRFSDQFHESSEEENLRYDIDQDEDEVWV
jgi:hypothetical protein